MYSLQHAGYNIMHNKRATCLCCCFTHVGKFIFMKILFIAGNVLCFFGIADADEHACQIQVHTCAYMHMHMCTYRDKVMATHIMLRIPHIML